MVAKFGPAAVWRAGLDQLGYPITWEPSTLEILTTKKAIENG